MSPRDQPSPSPVTPTHARCQKRMISIIKSRQKSALKRSRKHSKPKGLISISQRKAEAMQSRRRRKTLRLRARTQPIGGLRFATVTNHQRFASHFIYEFKLNVS